MSRFELFHYRASDFKGTPMRQALEYCRCMTDPRAPSRSAGGLL